MFWDPILHTSGAFHFVADKERAFDRAVGTVLSPFYGDHRRIGQKNIVIVNLDEGFKRRVGGSWPPPYAATNALLQTVLNARPRAIFLDTYFLGTHQKERWPDAASARSLAKTLQDHRIEGGAIPILTGPVFGEDWPLSLFRRPRSEVGIERLEGDDFAYRTEDDVRRPMAAVVLYKIWLGHEPPPLPETLALDWGFGVSDWSAARPGVPPICHMKGPGTRWLDLWLLFWRLALPNLQGKEAAEVDACPYFDSVSALDLGTRDIDAHLKGRLVLIGSTMASTSDNAETPLQSSVPGVTVHAMALDNLIQNGASVTHLPARHEKWLGLDNYNLLQFFLLTLGFMAIWAWRAVKKTASDEDLPWLVRFTVWLAILTLAVLVALLCHWPLSSAIFMVLVGGAASEAWEKMIERRRHRRHQHPPLNNPT